jgi:hypothetical protein
VAEAEQRGFPRNSCAWIKGIYSTARQLGVRRVIGVAQGDCSNTHALMEVLASEGVEVIDFNYPFPKDAAALGAALDGLARRLGAGRGRGNQPRGGQCGEERHGGSFHGRPPGAGARRLAPRRPLLN